MGSFMTKIVLLILFLIFTAGGLYYYLYFPYPYKQNSQQMLDTINMAIKSQNSDQIKRILGATLTDSTQVTLEVAFPSPPGQKTPNVSAEKFSKAEFLSFLDNILYTLHDYNFVANAHSVSLSKDKQSGEMVFTAKADAAGESRIDANMRFNGDIICNASVNYMNIQVPVITKLACIVHVE